MVVFPFHKIELMHCIRHPRPAQIMYKQVPVFQAGPCIFRIYSNHVNKSTNHTRTSKVPVKGNGTQHKTNEREGTVKLVRKERHCSSQMQRNRQDIWSLALIVASGPLAAGPRVKQGLNEFRMYAMQGFSDVKNVQI